MLLPHQGKDAMAKKDEIEVEGKFLRRRSGVVPVADDAVVHDHGAVEVEEVGAEQCGVAQHDAVV